MNSMLERIHAVLSTTPGRWQQLVSTFPVDLLTRPPREGEWSAVQCLQHLLDAELALFPVRFRAFLAGQDFTAFDPNKPQTDFASKTPEELAATFARARQDNLPLLEQVKDEDLERTVQHPQLGTVTLVQMLHTWAAHDLNHTIQAERALMQPFITGCGPWHTFFRDHEVARD